MENWFQTTGRLIEAIGTEKFALDLSIMLRDIAPFDYTVIFGFHKTDRPMDLFDDFPKAKRRIFVEDYQEGPYLLDPFFLACENPVPPALYRIRDLAPDRFFQGEYYRSYYERTGLAEEIAFVVHMPDDVSVVCVSLMRAGKVFSAKEFREFDKVTPIVSAACRQNWTDLGLRFSDARGDHGEHNLPRSVEETLRTFDEGLLTPREKEVVEFTLKGHSADAVGKILGISSGTVRIHRRNIYSKLRINSQGELFSRFIQALLGPEPAQS